MQLTLVWIPKWSSSNLTAKFRRQLQILAIVFKQIAGTLEVAVPVMVQLS